MNAAKYYIYRNLRTGGFSVKYRGRVIEHLNGPTIVMGAVFKVNELGRQRVIKEGQKNVHAYVVCDNYQTCPKYSVDKINKITYNPYKSSSFMYEGKPIDKVWTLYFYEGSCYNLSYWDF
jgi:hypothetical protein